MCPGELMASDMDIILVIQQLVTETCIPVTFHHVKGHADRQRQQHDELSRIERENIDCDEGAKEYVELNLTSPHYHSNLLHLEQDV
jgi:hypothetical protein